MLSEPSQRLADDHAALDEVLSQLLKALDTGDVAVSHARLDLFWARLAVHIRTEHLHLFPAVMNSVSCASADQTFSLTLSEAQSTVARLRADHEFFMYGLAQAMAIMRDLLKTTDRPALDGGIRTVRETILEIEKKLLSHNELEEIRIYAWAKTILNERELADLATQVNAELGNRPSRFSVTAWSNK